MAGKIPPSLRIDLNQFKLHFDLKNRTGLTLHFDSPSRRFYLSLIAFVVNQMKKLGKVTSIPLQEHLDLIILLNTTVGASAGSSEKENLLPRVYRKWKDALPNLEEAPLFRVLGRKKEHNDGIARTYQFTEAEKDSWANLFEYKGSGENVRLRFSIDRLGMSIEDVAIDFGGYLNGEAWERFISNLNTKAEVELKTEPDTASEGAKDRVDPPEERKAGRAVQYRWVVLIALIGVVLGSVGFVIWKTYWTPSGSQLVSLKKMAFPLPDKPSIAVLPFANMTGDAGQEFLVDGLTDNLITTLARVPQLFVIARNSTFVYKGKGVKAQQVAEELGIQYVLEGSVQRSGDKVRVTAQFIDALNGRHLWAEHYDRDMKDLFQLTDDISAKILPSVYRKLTGGGEGRVSRLKGPKDTEAYLRFLELIASMRGMNPKDNARAKRLAEELTAMDPSWSIGFSMLARVHYMDVVLGVSNSPKDSLAKALQLAEKAVAMDELNPGNYDTLGYVLSMMGEHEQALAEFEKASTLCPSCSDPYMYIGYIQYCMDETDRAIVSLQTALRLNPYPPTYYYAHLGNAYRHVGRYEEAIPAYKKAIQISPNFQNAYVGLVTSYNLLGREEEARSAAQEVLRVNPKFSIEVWAKTVPYRNREKLARFADALRKAGLK
jgi:adenylate cyclase